jgi:hypothetical protein
MTTSTWRLFRAPCLFAAVAVASVALVGNCLADNCDQECREREYFYSCPGMGGTTTYFEMDIADCFYCTKAAGAAGGGYCSKTTRAIRGTCTITGTNQRRGYNSGNQLCLCDAAATKWFIEATQIGPVQSWVNDSLYQCPR